MPEKTAKPASRPAKKTVAQPAARGEKATAEPAARNKKTGAKPAAASAGKAARPKPREATPAEPRLLSGGNPQIPKGYGDAPVQAYIAAMPGWKRELGRRLDELVERTVPGVRKAVKWNTPLYGVEEGRWFLAMHCFDRYLKVTFFRGAALDPPPAQPSKIEHVRYHHLHEHDRFDEARWADWIAQASRLPGERM